MSQATHNKMRMSITILPLIHEMLKKLSKRSGVSKSALVEHALKKFLQDQLDKDTKALAKIHCADLPSEDEWLSLQPNLE